MGKGTASKIFQYIIWVWLFWWTTYTAWLQVGVGFWCILNTPRTSFEVLLVVDSVTTRFPLQRFIVGNSPSPTRFMLIDAFTSRSTSSDCSSSQYSRIPQSVKTNSSRYASNWDVYAGFTAITLAPAFPAMYSRIVKNCPKAASFQDLFNPDFADWPLGKYLPFSFCLALFRFDKAFKFKFSCTKTFLFVLTKAWAVLKAWSFRLLRN